MVTGGNLTDDDTDFIEYIDDRLVPDLREGGFEATAEDIVRLRTIIDKLTEED